MVRTGPSLEGALNMAHILVLGTADWDQPIATNQHYMVRELAAEFEVTYLESIGLRTPQLRLRDLKRMWRRLSRSAPGRVGSRPRGAVRVESPRVIPRHTGVAARFNRWTLHRLLRSWTRSPESRVLWCYSPVTYGLERYADVVVYHCVDLLGQVDGIDSALIAQAETGLAECGAVAAGSSERVAEHLKSLSFGDVRLWPNVADTSTIVGRRPSTDTPRPFGAVFAGNLAPQKVDFALLQALIKGGVDLHLAGPVAEGGGNARVDLQRLTEMGATYHGMLTLDQLSDLYWSSCVGLIPYVINPYTEGVNPLKTYEYLAAGLPVVSTPVPAVKPWGVHVRIEDDNAKFVQRVIQACSESGTLDDVENRLMRAHMNSWTARGEEARMLVRELVLGDTDRLAGRAR